MNTTTTNTTTNATTDSITIPRDVYDSFINRLGKLLNQTKTINKNLSPIHRNINEITTSAMNLDAFTGMDHPFSMMDRIGTITDLSKNLSESMNKLHFANGEAVSGLSHLYEDMLGFLPDELEFFPDEEDCE